MDISQFNKGRDLAFYLEGDIAAFEESFPGVGVSHDMKRDMSSALAGIAFSEDMAGFTATIDSMPVGFVIVSLQWFYTMPQGYIDSIYVSEKHRRCGIANKLLKVAEKWAASKGARSIKLDVSNLNTNALSAYQELGFVATRTQMEREIAV